MARHRRTQRQSDQLTTNICMGLLTAICSSVFIFIAFVEIST